MALDFSVYSFVFSLAASNFEFCCRDTDFTERHLHNAGYPWSARTHHHALHASHGVAVSNAHIYKAALSKSSIMKIHH